MLKSLVLVVMLADLGMAQEASSDFKELFRQATVHYDLGKYERAAIEYEQLYEIRPVPELLYNIAQAYRLAGKPRKSLHFYHAYKRKLASEHTSNVDDHIAEVEASLKVSANLSERLQTIDEEPLGPIIVNGKIQRDTFYKYIEMAKVNPAYNLDLAAVYLSTTWGQAHHCTENWYPYLAEKCRIHASEPYQAGAVARHYRRYLKHFPNSPRKEEFTRIITQMDGFLESRMREDCLSRKKFGTAWTKHLVCDRDHNYGYAHEPDSDE